MQRQCRHAAQTALNAFRQVHGTDATATDAADLITDLLLMLQEQGEDSAAILETAAAQFAERKAA